MPRTPKLPKNEIILRLFRVFQLCGYEGASLKMLSDAAELSKASLYHYFPDGKEQMAKTVLARAGVNLQKHVFAPLQQTSDKNALLGSLDGVLRYYDGDIPMCLMNGLTMGTGGELFGDAIAKAVAAWRRGYEDCYYSISGDSDEAAAWSSYAIERIQGALIVSRVQGSRQPFEGCIEELKGDIANL